MKNQKVFRGQRAGGGEGQTPDNGALSDLPANSYDSIADVEWLGLMEEESLTSSRHLTANAGFNLCPTKSMSKTLDKAFTINNYQQWSVLPERQMKITCPILNEAQNGSKCKSPLDYIAAHNDSYRLSCIKAMPPTQHFTYSTTQFMNNKWNGRNDVTPDSAPINGKRAPELSLEVSHIFHYSHSADDELVEVKLANGRQPNGDVDQTNVTHLFFGAPYYRGKGEQGSQSHQKGFPSNNAFVKTSLQIKLAPTALDDTMKSRPHGWFWRSSDVLKKEQLDKFPVISVNWDPSAIGGSKGQVLLEPGWRYKFTADVTMWPVLYQPRFFPSYFEYYYAFGYRVNDNSVEKFKLDYFHKHEAVVHMVVQFSPEEDLIKAHNLIFDDFTVNIMAAFGYFAIGGSLLTAIQICSRKKDHYHEWAKEQTNIFLQGPATEEKLKDECST
jgi:hypothetical protein